MTDTTMVDGEGQSSQGDFASAFADGIETEGNNASSEPFVTEQAAPAVAEPVKPAMPSDPPEGFVRHEALHQSRMETKDLKRRLAEFEQASNAQRQQEPEPDIYTDTDAYMRHQFEGRDRKLADAMERVAMMEAGFSHGGDKTNEAQTAFNDLLREGNLPLADYQSVMTARNPFVAAIEWHQRTKALAEFGTDPQAYQESYQQKLLADPAFLAKAVEAARESAQGRPPIVTSRNSSKPANLPPSISNLGSVRSAAEPVSDFASRFNDD